jgi:uncharacterized protein DUF4350
VTRPAALLLLVALCVAFAWGLFSLFNAGFEAGGIYPAFSSLRKDPDGASVLFESVKRVAPATERSYLPLESVRWSHRTLLLLGANPEQMTPAGVLDQRVIERLARQGNRIVLALMPGLWANEEVAGRIEKAWGVKIQNAGTKDAREIHFSAGSQWAVLRGDRDDADVIERSFGPGSLVLVASSTVFSNSALAGSPDTALLVAVIGASDGTVFDEAHLGVVESGSVMGLLRAFHLQGLLLGLLLPVALLVWKYSTSFPPAPSSGPRQQIEGRRSFSGLVALLRRNLSPADLSAVGWQEWLKGAPRALPADRRAQVEQVLMETGAEPMRALTRIQEILKRKRTD